LKGNDRSLALFLSDYNSSHLITYEQRLQLRLQTIERKQSGQGTLGNGTVKFDDDSKVTDSFLLKEQSPLNEYNINCHEPHLVNWRIEPQHLFPSTTPNPLMIAKPYRSSMEYDPKNRAIVSRYYCATAIVMWVNDDDYRHLVSGISN
jgi:hypothetical protein